MKPNSKKEKVLTRKNKSLSKIKLKHIDEESEFAEKIFNTVREPLLLLDKELRVVKASRSFYEFFKVTSNKTIGKLIYDLGNSQWDIPKLRELLETILPKKTTFDNYEVEHDFSKIGKRIMLLNARKIPRGILEEQMILLAIEDITERKHKEESLSEKNRLTSEYLDILLNDAHVPIIIWDSTLTIKRFNHEFEKVSGYVWAEVKDKNIDILFPKDETDSTLELLKNNLSYEKSEVIEIDILTKDNNIRTVLWNSANIFDKEGKNIVATIAQDVTKSKLTEESLRESESLLNEAIKIADLGTWEYDVDCDQFTLTDQFYMLLHTTAEKEGGYKMSSQQYARKFVHPDDIFIVGYETKKALETTEPDYYSQVDHRIIYADGNAGYITVHIRIKKDEHGRTVKTYGVNQDITKRKQAEQKLRESEKRFRAIIDQAPIGIALLDMQGHPVISNLHLSKMVGYSNAELSKMKFTDFTYPEDIDKDMNQFTDLIDGKISRYSLEKRYVHKNGNLVWVYIIVAMLRDDDGISKEIIGMAEDISERKDIEDRIKFQSDLLFNVGQAVIAVDLQGKIIYWNNAAEKIYGWTSTEAMGQNIIDITPTEQTQKQAKEIMKKLSEGNSWAGEFLVKRKDGSSFPAYITDAPINDSNGQLIGIIGISSDITERKHAEEILRNERSLFRTLIDNIPDSIYSKDLLGRKTTANIAEIKNMGAESEAEVLGKDDFDFYPKELAEGFYADDQIVLKTGIPVLDREEFIFDVDGNKRFLLTSKLPLKDNKNQIFGLVGIGRDITERKRAEEEITMLAHSLKSISECVSITDIKDKIIFVNESFLKTYGFTESELLGKNMNMVRSSNNSPDIVKEILPTTLIGGWKGELWNKRKDGSEFLIYLSTSIIKNKEKKILGLIGVATDISERKRTEKELIEAKEKAEESDKLKSEFLAQMSHEIRTPLNAIVGNVEFLNESYGGKMETDTRDCFEVIELSTKRIIRTVDLILNIAELQTSGYIPNYVKVDLDLEILDKLYKQHLLSAKHKGLEMIYRCELKETIILADEYSVTQIFVNLIDNAIKYTKKGKVEIILEKNKTGNIVVEIKDTGIGISSEYLPKLFTAFTQEEQGYTRSFEGNGLGLTLVKNYCNINKAIIEVETEKNIGSTFRIIFDKNFTEDYNIRLQKN